VYYCVDTSCGEYATPVVKSWKPKTKDSVSSSRFSDSETSLDQNSDYVFLQVRTILHNQKTACTGFGVILRVIIFKESLSIVLYLGPKKVRVQSPRTIPLRSKDELDSKATVHNQW
jgi:hypothetical protein